MATTRRPNAAALTQWITRLTVALVESGLVDAQNFPVTIAENGKELVSFPNSPGAVALSLSTYRDLYEVQFTRDSYNFLMLDGALVQMHYEFEHGALTSHRLAFLPSPDLVDFQLDPELYLAETPYLDIVGSQATTTPIRFDYDARDGAPRELVHPASHLTIGQYQHCRIPVSGPVSPGHFVDFVIRHFYTGMELPAVECSLTFAQAFARSITAAEERVLHLNLIQ